MMDAHGLGLDDERGPSVCPHGVMAGTRCEACAHAWQLRCQSDDELAAKLLGTVDRCSHGEPLSEACGACSQEDQRQRQSATKIAALMAPGLSPAEAVFGVLAWLTCREKSVTLSAHHDSGVAANLAQEFCDVNGLEKLRDGWEKNLTHPEGPPTDHLASEVERPAGQSG